MNICIREISFLNENDIYNFARLHEQAPVEWDKNYQCIEESITRRQKIVLQAKNKCIFFAEENNNIIGIYWAFIEERRNEKVFLIGSLWVDRNYRKKGIATLLMNRGGDWALQKGVKFQFLNVHYNNTNAIEYYKNLGFVPKYLDMIKEFSSSNEDSQSNYLINETEKNKSEICDKILRSLPEWFGIESAIKEYVVDVETMPMLTIQVQNRVVGFLSYRKHFENSYEIHVMGVLPDYRGEGLGKKLIHKLQHIIKQEGAQFLQVKTLSPSRECEEYRQTREFYLALGFTPIEEFKELWGAANPCWLMMKKV